MDPCSPQQHPQQKFEILFPHDLTRNPSSLSSSHSNRSSAAASASTSPTRSYVTAVSDPAMLSALSESDSELDDLDDDEFGDGEAEAAAAAPGAGDAVSEATETSSKNFSKNLKFENLASSSTSGASSPRESSSSSCSFSAVSSSISAVSSAVPSIALSSSPIHDNNNNNTDTIIDPMGISKRSKFFSKLEEMHEKASCRAREDIAALEAEISCLMKNSKFSQKQRSQKEDLYVHRLKRLQSLQKSQPPVALNLLHDAATLVAHEAHASSQNKTVNSRDIIENETETGLDVLVAGSPELDLAPTAAAAVTIAPTAAPSVPQTAVTIGTVLEHQFDNIKRDSKHSRRSSFRKSLAQTFQSIGATLKKAWRGLCDRLLSCFCVRRRRRSSKGSASAANASSVPTQRVAIATQQLTESTLPTTTLPATVSTAAGRRNSSASATQIISITSTA